HQDRADIGADPEIGDMAERDQPGAAEKQVEADREERVDRDLLGEEGVVARADPRHRRGAQEDDEGPGDATGSEAVEHHRGRPYRPQGRTIRITAIRAKTENSEKLGKIRMPNDST